MSLPVIDTPKYHVTLPGNGEKVIFRPFTVKEQKQLLVAVNGDAEQQILAVEDIINACTFGKVNARQLAAYDSEYLFLQIRARSIGETVALNLTCSECGNIQGGSLDLTSVGLEAPADHKHVFEIDDQITVKMRDPDIQLMDAIRRNNTPDAVTEFIARSIQSIWRGDELFDANDYSLAELIDWVEKLNPVNLEALEDFFSTLPVVRHNIEFTCTKCNTKNVAVMEGLQSFFA